MTNNFIESLEHFHLCSFHYKICVHFFFHKCTNSITSSTILSQTDICVQMCVQMCVRMCACECVCACVCVHACIRVSERVCGRVAELLRSWSKNPRVVSLNPAQTEKLLCPRTSSSYTSPSSWDLEFSGVQIHLPLLVNQLRVQVGLRVPTHIC